MSLNTSPTFMCSGGRAIISVGGSWDGAYSVIQQSDGKLVLGGYSDNGNDADYAVVRLKSNGNLDEGFGSGGKVVVPVGGSTDIVYSVIQQADGKLVLAGYSYNGSNFDYSVVRLNSNGSLDDNFGNGGKVILSVGAGDDQAQGLILQSDGKLLLTGYSVNGSNYDYSVVRLNANGSLDSSFGTNGKAIISVGSSTDAAYSVIQQSDGKLVLAGYSYNGSNYDYSLVRLNANGSLDAGFGNQGIGIYSVGSTDDQAHSVIQQLDGKLVIAGYSYSGSSNYSGNYTDMSVVRLNVNGTLDTGFGSAGKSLIAVGSLDDEAWSVIQQADGKLVLGGYSFNGKDYDYALVRLNTNGSLDTSFGNNGRSILPVGSYTDMAWRLIQQSDGKLVMTGCSYNGTDDDFSVVRLTADGTLDTSFNATSSLGSSLAYTENAAPDVLDSSAAIYDADLAGLDSGAGNYAGASITLVRSGGAVADDVFSASGALSFSGSNAVLSGTTVGTVSNSGGMLTIAFNSAATQARVNAVLAAIAYSNTSDAPPVSVQIDWNFSDGNNGAQGTGGASTTSGSSTVDITATNDAPVISGIPASAQSVITGIAAALVDFTVADADGADVNLTVTLTSSNGTLGGLSDANTSLPGIQLSGIAAQINAAIAAATFTATAAGAATIEVSVSDGTVSSSIASYSLSAAYLVSTITGDAGNNLLSGTAGADSILGLAGNDTLRGGLGNDTLNGGVGSDYVSYSLATGAVIVDIVSGTASGAHGNDSLIAIENVSGSGYNDAIYGNSADNNLVGNAGNDTLRGNAGNDTLNGGDGVDMVSYAAASGAVTVDLVGGLATGADGSDALYNLENVSGSGYNDAIYGNSADNNLVGNAGNDTLRGNAGNDTLNGGDGVDMVSYAAASGAVTVNLATGLATGADGNDVLYNLENASGSGYADGLMGNSTANWLIGNAGNDTINGRSGSDTLTGGAGADIFSFGALSEMGFTAGACDVITDFVSGTDRIDLSALDADTATAGDQAFGTLTVGGTFSGTFASAGDLYYDSVARVLYGNNDADAQADFAIALTGVVTITVADLVL